MGKYNRVFFTVNTVEASFCVFVPPGRCVLVSSVCVCVYVCVTLIILALSHLKACY